MYCKKSLIAIGAIGMIGAFCLTQIEGLKWNSKKKIFILNEYIVLTIRITIN